MRCLVVIDLKIGPFSHADAGQMNLYLNYAKEHMVEPGENDPVGLILCSEKSDTVVRYAMGGINAKVFASDVPHRLAGGRGVASGHRAHATGARHTAKEPPRYGSLTCGVVAWLVGIGLVYLFFRLDRHGLTSAVLVMIVVHAAATAAIDWWWFGGAFGVRQAIGFVLAVAAVVGGVLDGL